MIGKFEDLFYTKPIECVSVKDVYGTIPTIPNGYEIVDFRPLRKDDLYWPIVGTQVQTSYRDEIQQHVRLILKPKRKVYIVEDLGTNRPQDGSSDGVVCLNMCERGGEMRVVWFRFLEKVPEGALICGLEQD